ncbi:uncharacterized protein LOC129723107 [Wyeomyia smithii]|uniref:uncharacterized protein LOC129723107 n=1 Tax=Wyeomyia smithii TaxID=174621 RepID=UPI0024681477|nr:uncharacterized protein LOC129723107 [Wyeomyia smithii]
MNKLLPLIVVAVTAAGWLHVTAGSYTLELDSVMENQLKNLTCVSYCDHCECLGKFNQEKDKCTCNCPEGAGDDECIAEVLETKRMIGLNYTLEVKHAERSQTVALSRVRRQVIGRARNRRQQRPNNRRRPRPTISPRPNRRNNRRRTTITTVIPPAT